MKKQAIFLVFSLLLTAGTLSAQDGWFVDPVAGSDSNGGNTQGDAFRTLGHALTQASAGDNVFCLPGTYSAGSGESFPIGLKNGVLISGLGGVAVFDGNGAAILFNLGGNVTLETVVSGVAFTDASLLFTIQTGRSVDGLLLQNCSFSSAAAGFAAVLSTAATGQSFGLIDCTFASVTGGTAVAVTVSDGVLASGGMTGCQILGDYATGISLAASGDAQIQAGFVIQGNEIAGCEDGFAASATGAGGNGLSIATIAATLIANLFDGADSVSGAGISLMAATGVLGEGARIAGLFKYNEVADFDVAVLASTDGDINNLADVISDFYGNLFTGAATGVQIEAAQPSPLNRNADPNFGGHPDGDLAGRNTFSGFALDFDLTPNQSADLYASSCWFDGAPVSQEGTVLTLPLLDDPLQAGVFGSILPQTAGEVLTLVAEPESAFVDTSLSGATGQIAVEVDGVSIPQADLEALAPGDSLTVVLPSLVSGLHTLDVVNPGGQTGTFEFLVGGNSGGEPASGCFVATAAHGDANAPEVLALRGLRDEYLATSAPGRSFISWYYREGPAAAAWIAERPWARAATRVALQPAVLTSRALTTWNPGVRFAFAVLLLGASFALLQRRLAPARTKS